MSKEKAADTLSKLVNANELERDTIADLVNRVSHGYKFIDIKVRKDSKVYEFEGDWLARLFRVLAEVEENKNL